MGWFGSFRDFLEEVEYSFGSARHVGKRYDLRAVFNGKEVVVQGIISNFLGQEKGRLFYSATGTVTPLIRVTTLVHSKGVWVVIIAVRDSLTQELKGHFRLL